MADPTFDHSDEASPLLLVPELGKSASPSLPSGPSNLFTRLIRNPLPTGRTVKERDCTEMLCATLIRAHELRTHLINHLGVGLNLPAGLAELQCLVETERAIFNKRDDLRLTFLDENGGQVAVWTFEVKVGAGFHTSSSLDIVESDDDVNQLVNYDAWLASQPGDGAGFVLAVSRVDALLPAGLSHTWRCISWTQLGRVVEQFLALNPPPVDRFLGRNLAGFIREFLWNEEDDMDDLRLDFNDIALIHSARRISACCSRASSIIAPLARVLEEHGTGTPAKHQDRLFAGVQRNVVYQGLVGTSQPHLFAGLTTDRGADLIFWIETSPGYQGKVRVRENIDLYLPDLRKLNPAWTAVTDEESRWTDVECRTSINNLLVADNQAEFVAEFTKSALNDVRQTGLLEALTEIAQANP